MIGKYCGRLTGMEVIVGGAYVVFTFHSNPIVQERGFRIVFNAVQPCKSNLCSP